MIEIYITIMILSVIAFIFALVVQPEEKHKVN